MRPKDTRKTLSELSRRTVEAGIDLEINPDRGKGSHQTLIFKDGKTGKAIHLTITSHREISPGVQRRSLSTLAQLADRVAPGEVVHHLATTAHGILGKLFEVSSISGDPQSGPKRGR